MDQNGIQYTQYTFNVDRTMIKSKLNCMPKQEPKLEPSSPYLPNTLIDEHNGVRVCLPTRRINSEREMINRSMIEIVLMWISFESIYEMSKKCFVGFVLFFSRFFNLR